MARLKQDIPEIRFEGFSGEWGNSKLGDLTKYIKGFAFSSTEFKKSGVRVIRVSDLSKNNISKSNEFVFVSPHYKETHKKYLLKKDDIIITTVGSKSEMIDSAVGRAIPVLNDTNALLNQNLVKISSLDLSHSGYIYNYLLLKRYREYISTVERGNANQANITIVDLWDYKVFHPSIEEQTQIGTFFQQLDKLIALQTRAVEVAERHKKVMLQKLFPQKGEKVPRIRFAGFSGDWKEHLLTDIVVQIKSYSLSRNVETTEKTKSKYIHYGDIHLKRANLLKTDSNLPYIEDDSYETLQLGDLVLADASEDYIGVAAACVVDFEPLENKLVAGLHTIALRPKQNQNSVFLYYFFTTSTFKKHCYRVGTGMKVFGITFNNLSKYKGYFPFLEEQTAIGNFFQKLDEKIGSETKKLEQYQLMKRAMLQRMFV